MEGPAVKRPKLNEEDWVRWYGNLQLLQSKLLEGCLCHLPTKIELQRPPLQSTASESEFPSDYTYQFISVINLLNDVALQQHSKGFLCAKLSEMATAVSSDVRIWEMLLEFLEAPAEKFQSFVTSKCLVSLLLWTKLPQPLNSNVFEELFSSLIGSTSALKICNILDIIQAIIDYKDEEEHPLEITNPIATSISQACRKIEVDIENESENDVKNICIKSLANWWTRLLSKFNAMLSQCSGENENAILSFLTLWQSVVSVKSNLSVIETKHFYFQIETFVPHLTSALPPSVWKKVLDVFNEILCYGSTLSLQDSLPDEPCNLAHLIIRQVKNRQFLQGVPYSSRTFYSFGGSSVGPVDWECESETSKGTSTECPATTTELGTLSISSQTDKDSSPELPGTSNQEEISKPMSPKYIPTTTIYIGPNPDVMSVNELTLTPETPDICGDKPLLQKVVLLVLKCVAVTVKETRDDDSDSSVVDDEGSGSASDSDTNDMIIIEKSIREVFQHLDTYVKSFLPFHPSMPLGEWIVKLFADQDDVLVEGMLCTLDSFTCFLGRIQIPADFYASLNPVQTFIAFAATVSEDKDTLLDLLMSNETCFLLYLLRFLKYVWRNWTEFVASCGRELEKIMGLLIRLRIALDRLVEKSLFPYNINPVVRLLEKCEEIYESSSTSRNPR